MLGIMNDFLGMWMGHVLQWVRLQGRVQGGEDIRAEAGIGEDLEEVGWSAEVDGGGGS